MTEKRIDIKIKQTTCEIPVYQVDYLRKFDFIHPELGCCGDVVLDNFMYTTFAV